MKKSRIPFINLAQRAVDRDYIEIKIPYGIVEDYIIFQNLLGKLSLEFFKSALASQLLSSFLP